MAGLLAQGGALNLAEGYPFALVFVTEAAGDNGVGRPCWYVPDLGDGMMKDGTPSDFTGDFPALTAGLEYLWDHQLGDILTALAGSGCGSTWLHEHDTVPRPMFSMRAPAPGGICRWPDKRWLPLAVSLSATNPARVRQGWGLALVVSQKWRNFNS